VYPLLVFGVIFLSVYVKSKAFLVFGTIFLIAYILKLTSEYFSSGLGWPLALVLAGLAIMAVGYYAVRINKRYLTTVTVK
jgi:ABC-type branched-subunit amino acid transport system permease subunit